MTHPFQDYILCRNNYFEDPDSVVELGLSQSFNKAAYYPGFRTENLLNFENEPIRDFAHSFADRLSLDVFPRIYSYTMSLYFHINENYNEDILNQGWIHRDTSKLAGLVYLTKGEVSLEHGTSIFIGEGVETVENKKLRENFNLYANDIDAYKKSMEQSWENFEETIKIGNYYNRLIAYDSKLYHRPNRYDTKVGLPRLSLVFFISDFKYNYE